MKKIAVAILVIFSVSMPLIAKKRSSGSNRGTAHRMNKTHANRTHTSGNKSCQVCETNFSTCMQNATNAQMKTMCSQMKEKCRASNKC
ncbi:hypothetical protein [Turneriella parva]|uniref:Uncharacterized protein n=1 Tax=Turneriella parva (strain ATCC BAA-1111 / DSM 21527 / NCTC 11395 / H) TaxID=869212 RepID=I4B8Y2_TURPD|nr:hypothetical protein [Turneriella parva]AFM13739.1 hypothetical protein Turpa_3100 [Turneriella parva DSM 21527]